MIVLLDIFHHEPLCCATYPYLKTLPLKEIQFTVQAIVHFNYHVLDFTRRKCEGYLKYR